MPSNWSSAEDTRDPANARLQETDNIRHHRFRQAKNVENHDADGASCARETASCSTNESASGLRRPPVSTPTTTSWHRSPSLYSAHFAFLSWRASTNTATSTVEAFGRARPHAVTALRTVVSTASCAPWFNSIPKADTSIARSSVAGTLMFMSFNLAFRLTVAPASRHTRARVRSVGTALERRRPERGHSARVSSKIQRTTTFAPCLRDQKWQSEPLENQPTCGTGAASRGTLLQWAPRFTPGWHMVRSVIAKWAWSAAQDWASSTVSRMWCSDQEDKWYCQP